jgi:hypothetical protein
MRSRPADPFGNVIAPSLIEQPSRHARARQLDDRSGVPRSVKSRFAERTGVIA